MTKTSLSPESLAAERDSPAVGFERKAIAFIDCCGYSTYTLDHGDHAAVGVYLRLRREIDREATATHVVVVKWMGDGVMLAADDSLALLTCVYRTMVAIREAGGLPLRAGVTVGQVAKIEQETVDYLGSSVNRAARLCSSAAQWQVRFAAGPGPETLHVTPLPLRVAEPSLSA